MAEIINILSLGAGVQSTTVLLMSCVGELPKLDCAIFADTQWEPAAVYAHLEWLESFAAEHGVPVHRVTRGNLRADSLGSQVSGKKIDGKRWASMPLRTLREWKPGDEGELLTAIAQYESKKKGNVATRLRVVLRQIERGQVVRQDGMVKRQCTREYKIEPIERLIKTDYLKLAPRAKWPKERRVRHWFGISADEINRARFPITDRKKPIPWKSNYYPLIGMEFFADQTTARDTKGLWFNRHACLEWIENRGFPTPPRSACIGCPYRSNDEWASLTPHEWHDAVEFDNAMRNCGGMRGQVFLHRDCVPLEAADLRTDLDKGQGELFGCMSGDCFV